MTSWLIMWETPKGERMWEALKKEQIIGFAEKLLNEGVHPATVIISYSPMLLHWFFEDYHNGLSDVNFHKINELIYGSKPIKKPKRKPIDVPIHKEPEKMKYGWLSPDGRFFNCDYGGHSAEARRIVGSIEKVDDVEKYLEDKGWAKILSGSWHNSIYAVGMGYGKKITDKQLKMLIHLGLDKAYGVSSLL